MKSIKIWNNKASEQQLNQLSERMKEGEIAIIPTDTM